MNELRELFFLFIKHRVEVLKKTQKKKSRMQVPNPFYWRVLIESQKSFQFHLDHSILSLWYSPCSEFHTHHLSLTNPARKPPETHARMEGVFGY